MNNNLRMKWKSKKHRGGEYSVSNPRPAAAPDIPYMTDTQIDLLACRYHANNICYLLDITFAAYLLAPKGWDRIARHLDDGGGCRMEAGQLVINHV